MAILKRLRIPSRGSLPRSPPCAAIARELPPLNCFNLEHIGNRRLAVGLALAWTRQTLRHCRPTDGSGCRFLCFGSTCPSPIAYTSFRRLPARCAMATAVRPVRWRTCRISSGTSKPCRLIASTLMALSNSWDNLTMTMIHALPSGIRYHDDTDRGHSGRIQTDIRHASLPVYCRRTWGIAWWAWSSLLLVGLRRWSTVGMHREQQHVLIRFPKFHQRHFDVEENVVDPRFHFVGRHPFQGRDAVEHSRLNPLPRVDPFDDPVAQSSLVRPGATISHVAWRVGRTRVGSDASRRISWTIAGSADFGHGRLPPYLNDTTNSLCDADDGAV